MVSQETPPGTSPKRDTPLPEDAEVFCQHHIGGVPVVAGEHGRLVGIVTHTALLGCLLALGRLLNTAA